VRRILSRILLVFGIGAIVSVMLASTISLSAAQEEIPYCAPSWARDWYIAGTPDEEMWWYLWWYQWCYTAEDGWFRVYDGWEWWGPVV
jgi:hypothetical protein